MSASAQLNTRSKTKKNFSHSPEALVNFGSTWIKKFYAKKVLDHMWRCLWSQSSKTEPGGCLEFEASLVYRSCSRTARATQCDPVSKKIIKKIGIVARQCAYAMLALRKWKRLRVWGWSGLHRGTHKYTHFYIHIKYRNRPKEKWPQFANDLLT